MNVLEIVLEIVETPGTGIMTTADHSLHQEEEGEVTDVVAVPVMILIQESLIWSIFEIAEFRHVAGHQAMIVNLPLIDIE